MVQHTFGTCTYYFREPEDVRGQDGKVALRSGTITTCTKKAACGICGQCTGVQALSRSCWTAS